MKDSNRPRNENPYSNNRKGKRPESSPSSSTSHRPDNPRPAPRPAPRAAFGGAQKSGDSVLGNLERKLVRIGVPLLPASIQTYHLTAMTCVWSLGVLLFSWKATENLHWMWMVSLMIVLQYFTDLFDGAVGRERKTGLIKWGFYMDHFLDYMFQAAVITGYYLISPPGLELYFMGILILSGGFMVSSFLSFASTNSFKIAFAGMGPTEIRLILIAINVGIIFLGTTLFIYTVPLIFFGMLFGLAAIVYRNHNALWEIDMNFKKKRRFQKPRYPRQNPGGKKDHFTGNRGKNRP